MHAPSAWKGPAAKITFLVALVLLACASSSASDTRSWLPGTTSAAAAPTGLVAAYSFDAGSGSVLADASGNGNNGTISGATWNTGGKNRGALDFDGVDDLVTVADSASLDLTGGMSLEAWVRPADAAGTGWDTVVLKEQPSHLAYALYSNDSTRSPSGHVYVGTHRAVAGASQLPATWKHVAVTYNGSNLRLYVDGVAGDSATVSGAIRTSSSPLRIGGNNVWGEYFAGRIDDVRIYNRALTAAEIQSDMNTPVGPPPSSDGQAPTAPTGLTVSGATSTTVSLAWTASTDDVGVTGYEIARGGTPVGTTAGTSYTVSGLTCGTGYQFTVLAYDAAANRSPQATVSSSTSECPAGDTTAPTAPGSFRLTGSSDTSLSVAWSASTDNVGVSGYGLYRNGSAIGSTAATTYSFTGLACNTSYALAVDSYDAAGNRSAKAQLTATTAACPLPGAADRYVSATGDDTNACTYAAPCRTFDRAYKSASLGMVVEVAAGSYPSQTINHDASKPAAGYRILFRPAAGATVTATGLTNYASNVHYKDFLLPTGSSSGSSGVALMRGGKNVTIENITATKPYVWNTGTVPIENLLILGGNFGPHPSCGGGAQITDRPKNVTIDGAIFHDFTVPASCSSAHLDCVHTFGGDGLTIRNSTFRNCRHFGILVNGGSNVTVENNFLDGGIYGFKLRGDTSPSVEVFTNVLIRFNSADEISLGAGGSNTLNNVRVENNAATSGVNCRSGVTYTGNYRQNGSSCGSTDRAVSSLGFTSPGQSDFHLTAGSPLIDAATGTSYPTTDYDHQPRPAGARPDVGADERS